MKKQQAGFGGISILLLLVVLGIIGTIGWLMYQTDHKPDKTSGASKPQHGVALMIVTSSGGLCDGPCKHPRYYLYDDGIFEGYKKLTGSEVSQLKHILDNADLVKYAPNPQPHCESFVDGWDQVLLFPQKYGDQTFTPCMLAIPSSDPTFTFIDNLLESHALRSP